MILGYIRVSRAGPSEAEQRAAVSAHAEDMKHGCWVDVEKGARPYEMKLVIREKVITSCRAGDVVAVATADRLGRGGDDIRQTLLRIIQRGAAVMDCETGEVIRSLEGLPEALGFILRAEAQLKRRSAEKMVRTRLAHGNLGGKPPQLRGARRQRAAPIWADMTLTAAEATAKINEALGTKIAVRTLYRILGTRGGHRPGRPT